MEQRRQSCSTFFFCLAVCSWVNTNGSVIMMFVIYTYHGMRDGFCAKVVFMSFFFFSTGQTNHSFWRRGCFLISDSIKYVHKCVETRSTYKLKWPLTSVQIRKLWRRLNYWRKSAWWKRRPPSGVVDWRNRATWPTCWSRCTVSCWPKSKRYKSPFLNTISKYNLLLKDYFPQMAKKYLSTFFSRPETFKLVQQSDCVQRTELVAQLYKF